MRSPRKKKILLAGFNQAQVKDLRRSFPKVEFRPFESLNTSAGSDVDAVIGAHRAAFDAVIRSGLLTRCRDVRWVHAPGAGIEAYFGGDLSRVEFTLTNGKILQGPEVADHALGLLLALTRTIAHHLKGMPCRQIPMPIELRGKVALIIGFGGIGMGIAERVRAFGMSVIVVTETNFPYVSFTLERFWGDQLLEALPSADVVFIAAPLTVTTRKLLNDRAFRRMKRTAYLINVARGAIVDTEALVSALKDRRLAGAALDVTDPEPLPDDHPLHKFANVIITPHIAGTSDALAERNYELITTNIRRFAAGHSLINTVDKMLGF